MSKLKDLFKPNRCANCQFFKPDFGRHESGYGECTNINTNWVHGLSSNDDINEGVNIEGYEVDRLTFHSSFGCINYKLMENKLKSALDDNSGMWVIVKEWVKLKTPMVKLMSLTDNNKTIEMKTSDLDIKFSKIIDNMFLLWMNHASIFKEINQ